jgi:diadenylate cyclase
MESITNFFGESFNYITLIGIMDVVDILLVAFIIYKVVELVRKTSSTRVAKGIVILLLALWLSGELKLTVINFLLRKAVELGLLALVILFQPELRRFLEKVGSGRVTAIFGKDTYVQSIDMAITQTVLACTEMSKTRTGALIIFERANRLNDQISTGTIIDADTTAELLKNIFYPKAPLHDGAVIIREARIAAAGCMLPLSGNTNLSRDLGMRHRAGIGMSEHSDAVVAIVSEETGSISVAVDGMLKRHLAPDTFEKLLRNELISEEDMTSKQKSNIFTRWLKRTKNDKKSEDQ